MTSTHRRLSSRVALAALAIGAIPIALTAPGCALEHDVDGTDGLVAEAQQALSTCVTVQRGLSGTVDEATLAVNVTYLGWQAPKGTLKIDSSDEALLRFDVSAVPANATVNSATLSLYTTTVYSGALLYARAALVPWTTATTSFATFNQQAGKEVMGGMVPTTPNTIQTMNLKLPTVQGWVNGSVANDGLALETMITRAPNWQAGTVFASSDAATVALRPSLKVCYTTFNYCASAPCLNGASCNNDVAGYTCACAPGFTGTNCEININDCAGNPCLNGATCADGVNSYTCACAPGYSGANCEIDINECAPAPCANGGVCSDHVAAYSCACPAGFTGTNCEININDCAGSPCQNGGACADGVNSYTCACAPGYAGTNCQTDIDDCVGNACQNGSICVDGVNAYTCACAPGYNGALCQVDINDCAGSPCQNGGACLDGINSYSCQCAAGFTGATCQTNINDCLPNPCLNGGACTDGVNSYTCQCAAGYTGVSCSVAPGPTIKFAGSDYTTHDRWRTASTLKLLDVDGDNIYGTNGWRVFGGNSVQPYQAPSYATVAQAPGTSVYSPFPGCRTPGLLNGADQIYICMNDPGLTDGTSCRTGTVYSNAPGENDLVTITMTAAKSFRVGEIQDIHDRAAISPASVRLRQTVGGSADSGLASAASDRNLNGDMYLFDVTNAKPGDVFVLSGVQDPGHPSNGVWGVFFDGGH